MADATAGPGHRGPAAGVLLDVNLHDPNTTPVPSPSADRCLRHHVWMAACGDCREAHAPLLSGGRRRVTTAR